MTTGKRELGIGIWEMGIWNCECVILDLGVRVSNWKWKCELRIRSWEFGNGHWKLGKGELRIEYSELGIGNPSKQS